MPEQTKPPITVRRVYATDLAVEAGGATYYPHAEEWVEYRGRPSMGVYLKIVNPESNQQGMRDLLGMIHDWSFTDDEGHPYARPPTLDDLMRMPTEDQLWILKNVDTVPDEEARKNASGGST